MQLTVGTRLGPYEIVSLPPHFPLVMNERKMCIAPDTGRALEVNRSAISCEPCQT